MLFPVTSQAWDIFELREVTIDYKSIEFGSTDPVFQSSGLQNREPDKYLGVNINLDIFHYFYMNNLVHGTSDSPTDKSGNGQFRIIGWQYELGLHFTEFLDLTYGHHSQHLLDYQGTNHFPVENYIGFRLKLFQSHKESGRIW
jgi:hypothetical protein